MGGGFPKIGVVWIGGGWVWVELGKPVIGQIDLFCGAT